MPEAACAAIDGRPPVLRSDGSPVRDLLYVEDAAAAYLAIADHLDRDDVRGEAFNAGGERPYSVLEIVATIARLAGTGVEPDVRGAGNPAGEIDRQFVDAAKLRERCGWRPRVGLEEGLGRTLEWYRAHPEVRPRSALDPGRPVGGPLLPGDAGLALDHDPLAVRDLVLVATADLQPDALPGTGTDSHRLRVGDPGAVPVEPGLQPRVALARRPLGAADPEGQMLALDGHDPTDVAARFIGGVLATATVAVPRPATVAGLPAPAVSLSFA